MCIILRLVYQNDDEAVAVLLEKYFNQAKNE